MSCQSFIYRLELRRKAPTFPSRSDSDESRKQLNDILMKRKESLAELRQRIAKSTLKPEDLRINRPPYRKTSDLFASEFETFAPSSWPPSVCAVKTAVSIHCHFRPIPEGAQRDGGQLRGTEAAPRVLDGGLRTPGTS